MLNDLFLLVFLAFLEGILSIDNALVLAMMARHLPPAQRRKALTYGLVGSVVFRLISLMIISHLLKWVWVKFVGGGYLIIVALKHLLGKSHAEAEKSGYRKMSFWKTVVMIELIDIAFAVDSILAAMALTQKFWIVFAGGMMGVILMRFAASAFIKLLEKYPAFETTAFLMILIIGIKVVIEGFAPPWADFHGVSKPAFWIFWGLMAASLAYGFTPRRKIKIMRKSTSPS